MIRLTMWLLGSLTVAAGGYQAGNAWGWWGPQPLAVRAAPLARTTIQERILASGKVQPAQAVPVAPDVSGEITAVFVQEGQWVAKGQPLLRLRADTYQAQLTQQSARLAGHRAAVEQAWAQLAQQRIAVRQAQLLYQRQSALFAQHVIARVEWEKAQTDYAAAQRLLDGLRSQVEAAQLTAQGTAAGLDQARLELAKTLVLAPVAGTVSRLAVQVGERIVGTSQRAGTELLRLADLRALEVEATLGELNVGRVQVGDSADVEVDAYVARGEAPLRGVVTAIAPTARLSLTPLASTEYDVRIRLLPASYAHLVTYGRHGERIEPLRPGMTASAEICTARRVGVLCVPLAAVTTRRRATREGAGGIAAEQSGRYTRRAPRGALKREEASRQEVVFVVRQGRAYLTPVTTGVSDHEHIEIVQGLRPGDQVVAGPFLAISKTLTSGTPVRQLN